MNKADILQAERSSLAFLVNERFGEDLHNFKTIDLVTDISHITVRGIDGFDGTQSEVDIIREGESDRRGRDFGIALEEKGTTVRVRYVKVGGEIIGRRVTVSGMDDRSEEERLKIARLVIDKAMHPGERTLSGRRQVTPLPENVSPIGEE